MRVVAGVLTPVPGTPSPLAASRVDPAFSDDDATRLITDEDITRFVAAAGVMPAAATTAPPDVGKTVARVGTGDATRILESDDVTRLASVVGAAHVAADEVTRFVSTSVAPHLSDDDLTRLVSAAAAARRAADDATRLVDEYVTRVGGNPAGPFPAGTAAHDVSHDDVRADGPLAVGQSFGRYHIIRALGTGGMGAVYHAWDGELGATVALKVIRPEATRDPVVEREMARRFKQELVLARKVTHKNVVRIHDLGEINGIKFISMPYLDGKDLATVLVERETLPVPEALRIVRDVAAGLVAAHEAGIVHRDLKPANVMIQQDVAIIMDFGIARSTTVPEAASHAAPAGFAFATAGPADATIAGTVLGTVRYMAPEQALGQAVDQRADVYALGLMFADMLVPRGRRAAGASPLDDLKRRMEQAPARVGTFDAEIPEAVDAVIARCLQPNPDARFQTSKELVHALDRIDARGHLIKQRKVVGLPLAGAVPMMLLLLLGGVWWYYASLIPPPTIPPMKLVIADFENGTGDPSFDQTLEPMLLRGLEESRFISAYDRSSIRRFLGNGEPVPATLSAKDATELAINHGVGTVIVGAVVPQPRGFDVSVRAIRPVTQEVLASLSRTARNKQDVIATVAALAASIRGALGDDTADTRFSSRAADPLSTTSLEVAREYGRGMNALSDSKNEEALQAFSRAIQIDSKFGLAYAGLAIASRNLDRQQDAVKYADQAIRYVDSMTKRERFRTRGLAFLVAGDYKNCVETYDGLTKEYSADAAAYNNLALCATHMRDFEQSLKARRQAKDLLPTRSVYRFNLAIDATYAGEFATGELEAQEAKKLGSAALGSVALAFAQLALDRTEDARSTYGELAKGTGSAASRGRSGLAELAAYEGRYAEAVRLFEEGTKQDLAAKNTERAADKLAGLAYVHLLRGQASAARTAAEQALAASPSSKIRFLTGRIFAEAGDPARAREAMTALASEVQDEPRALARILEGNIALAQGDPRAAIGALKAANDLVDTWVGRFDLGRAYLAARLLTQADSEFDRCLLRRGEALSLSLDDEPTFGYLPALYYYQGRVREELKTARFADAYRTYLNIRGGAGEDPLLGEVRRRALTP